MLSLFRLSRTALGAVCPNSKVGVDSTSFQVIRAFASYVGAERYDPNSRTNYEVCKSPEEWKYVERLIPSKLIPEVVPKDTYPSGWRPPSDDALKRPYYVRRSMNHMIPVYMRISHRGMKRVTIVRRVEGDIWRFEKDLKQHLMKTNKDIGIRVDEVGGKVVVRGDFVHDVSQWLESQGF